MIVGVVGPLGSGKSGYATQRAIRMVKKRKGILASNIRLTPPEGVEFVHVPTGDEGLDVDFLAALRERAIAEQRRIVMLIDEAGIAMGARFWASSPAFLTWWLAMSRKAGGADVFWTTHHVDDVETVLRRRTSFTYSLVRIPSGGDDGTDRAPWFLVVRRWYGVEVGKRGRRMGWPSIVRWRKSWMTYYDTDELVQLSGRVVASDARKRARIRESRSEWQ